jgi:hypothetical protein
MRSCDALPMQQREPVITGSVDLKSGVTMDSHPIIRHFWNPPLSRFCAEE